MVILENIDIDKAILQNIDIDKISNRFKFGITNRANSTPFSVLEKPLGTNSVVTKIDIISQFISQQNQSGRTGRSGRLFRSGRLVQSGRSSRSGWSGRSCQSGYLSHHITPRSEFSKILSQVFCKRFCNEK